MKIRIELPVEALIKAGFDLNQVIILDLLENNIIKFSQCKEEVILLRRREK